MCAVVIKQSQFGFAVRLTLAVLCLFAHFSSEEWNKVSKSEREKLGVTVQDDGEFW